MTRKKDHTGHVFGELTIMGDVPSKPGKRTVRAVCSCGNEIVTSLYPITRGRVTHCGCLTPEKHPNATHGESKTPLYRVWASMKQRCYDPAHQAYPDYGGRGIEVCHDWQEYLPFREWAYATGYSGGLTIDRINTDEGYYPTNCRWADRTVQATNRRKKRRTASRYIGVSKWSAKGKTGWQARISVDGKNTYLGVFSTQEEAAQAREDYIDQNGLQNFTRNQLP